jgi:HEAT repeat protein
MHNHFVGYYLTMPTPRKFARIIVLAMIVFAGCRESVDTRIRHAYAFARHPTDAKKSRLEALLRDEDRDVRATALVAMESVDHARALQMALGALDDSDGLVRAAAVNVLAIRADPAMILGLAARAVNDPVWQVRSAALDAISSSDEPAVREAFARALSDSVRHVRRAALRAGIQHPGLLPADRLSDLVVRDPDWENRVDAAHALGGAKDPAAYTGLDAAVRDPNEFVRSTADRERKNLQRAGVPRAPDVAAAPPPLNEKKRGGV